MFAELPKLFDRDFTVGYFLPVGLFLAASLTLAGELGWLPAVDWTAVSETDLLVGSTLAGLAAWVGGVGLLVLNRDLIQLLEGYGAYNPVKALAPLERRRFRRLQAELDQIKTQRQAARDRGEPVAPAVESRRMQLMTEWAARFPDDEQWLLPTAFGNTIRAFEVYPRVMYGFDAIPGWSRLLSVIPKDFRELIDAAKAQMDFWVNLGVLSLLFVVEYILLNLTRGQMAALWLLALALFANWLSFSRARAAAEEWGDWAQAAFDVFLVDLRVRVNLPPADGRPERELWTRFSQAITYRLPGPLQPPAAGQVPRAQPPADQPRE